ncbi:hypothetical protein PVK06_008619 [Gossypium arboreum]|uniref:Uncharacterized protein n=1 Tax=Gossypium arboreum TaxID=29729 RepID=A0ABR0QKQ9_GOSAR|nr:hypothetical protein PVK06_008619 [Gossypium arboreum]
MLTFSASSVILYTPPSLLDAYLHNTQSLLILGLTSLASCVPIVHESILLVGLTILPVTPHLAKYAQEFFLWVKSLGILPKQPPMRTTGRSMNFRDRYVFHNDMRHKTEDCFTLKDVIEDAVCSNTKRRAYMRDVTLLSVPKRSRYQEKWNVEFESDNEELICDEEGNDPMVVSATVTGFKVKRILVDSGSIVKVL